VSSLRINKRYTTIPTSVVQTTIPTLSQYFSFHPMPHPASGVIELPRHPYNGSGGDSKSSAYRKHHRSFRLDGSKSGHYFWISFDLFCAYYNNFVPFILNLKIRKISLKIDLILFNSIIMPLNVSIMLFKLRYTQDNNKNETFK